MFIGFFAYTVKTGPVCLPTPPLPLPADSTPFFE